MLNTINNFFNIKSYLDLGNRMFLLGTFFLPTALPISALFFIISLVISYSNKNIIKLNEKWNYPLFFSIGIIVFSTFNISFINKPIILKDYDNSLVWINLMNWIPIFFYYWGFQEYLKTYLQRLTFTKFLISGSIPVILSFILQKFFNLYGPFKTFFGLIVWFQKPLTEFSDGVSGLFSNPNYAGAWLALVLPFSIFLVSNSKKSKLSKFVVYFIFICFIYMILMTGSRNALLAVLISLLFAFRFKKLLNIIVSISSLFITINIFEFIFFKGQLFNSIFLKSNAINKIITFDLYSAPRLVIWKSTFLRILNRPFLGWGPSTFSSVHIENNQSLISQNSVLYAQHSHNIFLELAHNFGLPLAIILVSTIILFLINSWSKIFLKNLSSKNIFLSKIWFCSLFIFFVIHLSDITFYDGKISLFICILFAGLKSISDEIEGEKKINNFQ